MIGWDCRTADSHHDNKLHIATLVKAISGMQSVSQLQKDLWLVIQWSQANNMLLHEKKFEVLNYVLNTSSLLRQLPFTSGCKEYTTTEGTS